MSYMRKYIDYPHKYENKAYQYTLQKLKFPRPYIGNSLSNVVLTKSLTFTILVYYIPETFVATIVNVM